jgi:predicted Rossmann fold flavoprotein
LTDNSFSNQTTYQNYDVVILGAGAAGLLAGFTAARRNKKVLILEKANKVGKKILMSGGGRCNFTNEFVEPHNFISDNPNFCISALNQFNVSDFLNLVEKHSIHYEKRKNNQFFCKNSSTDILDMLLTECQQSGVRIETHSLTTNIDYKDILQQKQGEFLPYRFSIETTKSLKGSLEHFRIKSRTLIVATGALSVPTLGGSGFGYEVAKTFGLNVTVRQSGLVPFIFNDDLRELFASLSGVSTRVQVKCNGAYFTDDILFTHRGLSGPAILQISNYWSQGDSISIDLLPGIRASEELINLRNTKPFNGINSYLNQHLPRSLISKLKVLWWTDLIDRNMSEISNHRLSKIGTSLNNWLLKPPSTEGYRTAEVTRGGVDTKELSSKTMEARNVPGLYFIGEVLDVTGQLGGFNFQWAWASGYSAGVSV